MHEPEHAPIPLEELAEAIPVAADRNHVPQKRTRRKKAVVRSAAVLTAVSVIGIGVYAVGNQDGEGTEITADGTLTNEAAAIIPAGGDGSSSFSQRIVTGPVSFPSWSGYGPDGTLYMLSTAPGVKYPAYDEEGGQNEEDWEPLPQALYSTSDGENWTINELGEINFDLLHISDGLIYGISTAEGANGEINYEYLRTGDGGATWQSSVIPVSFDTPTDPWLTGQGYGHATTAVTDRAHLITVERWVEPNMEWFAEKLGVQLGEGSSWPELTPDGVLVRDYSECERLQEEAQRQIQEKVDAAMETGLSEEEAWAQIEETIYATEEDYENSPWGAADRACQDAPASHSMTYAELGIDDPDQVRHGRSFRATFRSTDGIEWAEVDAPGNWIYPVGNQFVAEEWSDYEEGERGFEEEWVEPTATYFTSPDGLSWTESDAPPNQPYRQGLGTMNGNLASFRTESAYSGEPGYGGEAGDAYVTTTVPAGYEETTVPEAVEEPTTTTGPPADSSEEATTVVVDEGEPATTSVPTEAGGADGETTTTAIPVEAGSDEVGVTTTGVPYPEFDEGSYGGVEKLSIYFGTSTDGANWDDTLIYEHEESGEFAWPSHQAIGSVGAVAVIAIERPEEGVGNEGDYSYEDYLAIVSHLILYSSDGVTWQEIEITDPPPGELTNVFVTNTSVGFSYQTIGEAESKTSTVLLTPER